MIKLNRTIGLLLIIFLSNYTYGQSYWFNNYHITNKVIVKNKKNILTKLVVIMPIPQTNIYQDVLRINTYKGVVAEIPQTDDKYIRWLVTDFSKETKTFEFYIDFDIKIHRYNFDFSKVKQEYPYDINSDIYKWNTVASGDEIAPDYEKIQKIADVLWSQSQGIVDYARRCSDFVVKHFKYMKSEGRNKVEDYFKVGGGDCGNLSAIFISLLRNKKVPSRPIVTVRPDGSPHVWADFYLEKYGWIPVDVTYQQGHPSEDSFGKYIGDGIVYTKGLNLMIDKGDNSTYRAGILQGFNWFYYCSDCSGKIAADFDCKSEIK